METLFGEREKSYDASIEVSFTSAMLLFRRRGFSVWGLNSAAYGFMQRIQIMNLQNLGAVIFPKFLHPRSGNLNIFFKSALREA